ncbi:hypothetical protein ACA910_002760 [Epithemia clementina (nom. ined.)]
MGRQSVLLLLQSAFPFLYSCNSEALVLPLKPRRSCWNTIRLYRAVEEGRDDEIATFYSPNVPLVDKDTVDGRDELSSVGRISEYSFFDEAFIYVRAGSGGQGASTYKKIGGTGQNGPPDGGNGGKGGNVILSMDPSLNTLAGLTYSWRPNAFGGGGAAAKPNRNRPKSFRAENGADGGRQLKRGRVGKDVTIRVPPETVVQEVMDVYDENKDSDGILVEDRGILSGKHDTMVVARGGEGGEGSGIQTKSRGIRTLRSAPTGGERKLLKLTLKIVADVAVIGVPNAGKSTFLASVTRAKPKIANYPFTTVIPNLGVWSPDDLVGLETDSGAVDSLVLCDVPGLVAGAAEGVGLGHAFLRHVERCHVILHLVDATSNDPVADYQMLNRELVKYGTGQLANIPQVVVVNKVDAFEGHSAEEWEKGLQVKVSREVLGAMLQEAMPHSRLMWMSAKEQHGVDDLMMRLAAFVKKVKDAAK